VGTRHLVRVVRARRRLRALLSEVAGEDARVVITGATSGIGQELTNQIAKHPSAAVLVGCRDTKRAQRLFRCWEDKVTVVHLELKDPDSVQSFVDEAHDFLGKGGPGLRMLVNNAGVMPGPSGAAGAGDPLARRGPGTAWQTNFLGVFLLTELLSRLRQLPGSPKYQPVSVVQVSSRLERRSALSSEMLEELKASRPVGSELKPSPYADSKRALMLWTSVRAQNLAFKGGLFCHAATPGMVDTQLGRHSVRPWLWPLTKPVRWLLLRSPAEGALAVGAAGLRARALDSFGKYMAGEEELEDLVMERMGEKRLCREVVKWATEATALEQRAAGYER